MALTQISTGGIKDDAVTDAKLPANSVGNSEMKDDAVGVAELSATGTASSSTFLRGDNSWVTPTDTNTQLSTEEVQDIVGAMFTGNTETNITATYEDSDGTIDLVASAGVGGATGVTFNDTVAANFGTDGDQAIWHTGSAGYIRNSTGGFCIRNDNFSVKDDGESETLISAVKDGAVELYHNGVKKLNTDSGGIEVVGAVMPSGNISMVDSAELKIGTSDDLKIYHDGTYNWIDAVNNHGTVLRAGTGILYLQGSEIHMGDEGGNEVHIKTIDNGAVELYHDNSKKVQTTDYGIGVTGTCFATSDFQLDDGCAYKVGTGDDLQIYHDGTNSWVDNTTGNLLIRDNTGDIYLQAPLVSLQGGTSESNKQTAKFTAGGSVELYHNDAKKFETTSGGISVTGGINLSTNLSLVDDSEIKVGTGDDLKIFHQSSYPRNVIETSGADFVILTSDHDGTAEKALGIARNGAVELYYDGAKKLETTSAGGTLHGSWTGLGVTEADQWRLTSNAQTNQNPLDNNWERCDMNTNGFQNNPSLGSGVSESSGVFTFGTTGKWLVNFTVQSRQSDENNYVESIIAVTGDNGSNWVSASVGYGSQHGGSGQVYTSAPTQVILDVTDTSNQKVRFACYFEQSSNAHIIGNSDANLTYVTFIKLGET